MDSILLMSQSCHLKLVVMHTAPEILVEQILYLCMREFTKKYYYRHPAPLIILCSLSMIGHTWFNSISFQVVLLELRVKLLIYILIAMMSGRKNALNIMSKVEKEMLKILVFLVSLVNLVLA